MALTGGGALLPGVVELATEISNTQAVRIGIPGNFGGLTSEYRSPDFDRLKQMMARPALFDGRNQWDRAHVENLGFFYAGIGR